MLWFLDALSSNRYLDKIFNMAYFWDNILFLLLNKA
jgi:hypothetical protein